MKQPTDIHRCTGTLIEAVLIPRMSSEVGQAIERSSCDEDLQSEVTAVFNLSVNEATRTLGEVYPLWGAALPAAANTSLRRLSTCC